MIVVVIIGGIISGFGVGILLLNILDRNKE